MNGPVFIPIDFVYENRRQAAFGLEAVVADLCPR